jgi:hypothetical protein
MVKKGRKEKHAGGRPKADPRSIRSERLVLRVHPDLMGVLDNLANESLISRSQLVERILITFCNQDPRVNLDLVGRRVDPSTPTQREVLASAASFERRWKGFAALRAAALAEPTEEDDGPPPPEGS